MPLPLSPFSFSSHSPGDALNRLADCWQERGRRPCRYERDDGRRRGFRPAAAAVGEARQGRGSGCGRRGGCARRRKGDLQDGRRLGAHARRPARRQHPAARPHPAADLRYVYAVHIHPLFFSFSFLLQQLLCNDLCLSSTAVQVFVTHTQAVPQCH